MRRPATYPEEPVTPEMLDKDDVFVPSGPRSSSRIELNPLLSFERAEVFEGKSD